MTARIIEKVALHCRENGSDKVWGAVIIDCGNNKGAFIYCHGGVSWDRLRLEPRSSTLAQCRTWYQKKVSEKIDKGYKRIEFSSQRIESTLMTVAEMYLSPENEKASTSTSSAAATTTPTTAPVSRTTSPNYPRPPRAGSTVEDTSDTRTPLGRDVKESDSRSPVPAMVRRARDL